MPGETTLIGLKKQEVITAEDKITALKTNYEDPFIGFISKMRDQGAAEEVAAFGEISQPVSSPSSAYIAPSGALS